MLEEVLKLPFEKKRLVLELLEMKAEASKRVLFLKVFNNLYDWQTEFVAATANYYECCLCAANQIGKSYLGVELDAMHLLGDYPDNWPGHRFTFPPYCWALGFSMEKTRDLLQTKLFGKINNRKFEGGLIPVDRIVGFESAGGTVNAMRTVTVKHKLGIATIQFWSYSQGQHAIMGDVVDWFHIDEEPKDQKIRPQVLTRTINGDKGKGGRGIYTFTPENGKTDLVLQFMENASSSQFFMQKGWRDAPHITAEKAERLLQQYPEYQREMRSTGTPMLGHGRIYDIGDEFITVDPFEIPDHWFVIGGLDFGWDHPQAQIRLVEDRDQGNFYLVNVWKASRLSANDAWGACKAWQAGIPVAWPADGLQHEKGRDNAVQQKKHYVDAGFNMLYEHATWAEGGNSVEAGLMELLDLMRKGKFKVFRGLIEFFDEFRQYHRNETGHIVKVRDDILDACFHPDTEVITKKGVFKIKDLEGSNGHVLSLNGSWQKYSNCRITKQNADLIKLVFEDGSIVVCTPDHKFLVGEEWISAICLYDKHVTLSMKKWKIQFVMTALFLQNLAGITGQAVNFCIDLFGKNITAKYLKGFTYTTLTKTEKTTALKTCNVLKVENISAVTIKEKYTHLLQQLKRQANGAKPKLEKQSVLKRAKPMLNFCKNKLIAFVKFAKNYIQLNAEKIDFAQTRVDQNGVELAGLMMCPQVVKNAITNLKLTKIALPGFVQKNVVIGFGSKLMKEKPTLKVLQIKNVNKKSNVYCMSVENSECFALKNGVIAHNCRYAYMMRRYAVQIGTMNNRERAYIPSAIQQYRR